MGPRGIVEDHLAGAAVRAPLAHALVGGELAARAPARVELVEGTSALHFIVSKCVFYNLWSVKKYLINYTARRHSP